jgi:hypothetical protein
MSANVFISYSQSDKRFARRLARRLGVYGVEVWLDENELELGRVLADALKNAIANASHLLVVASEAAAESEWVGREMAYAQSSPQKPILIPIFIAPTERHPRFNGFIGVDFKKRYLIDLSIAKLAQNLTNATASPDAGALKRGLAALKKETPALVPVIDACLGDSQMTVSQHLCLRDPSIPFDDLEYALTSSYEAAPLERKPNAAWIAAQTFPLRGAGSYVLRLDLAAKLEGRPGAAASGNPLARAIGTQLDVENLECALDLLATEPRNDDALGEFIRYNFNQCDDRQRANLAQLVTIPHRGPGSSASQAAYELYSRMPQNVALASLWHRWISDGNFEADSGGLVSELFHFLCDGAKKTPEVWQGHIDAVCSRVRRLAEFRDITKIDLALEYVRRAADCNFSKLDDICRAVETGIHGSGTWDRRLEMSVLARSFLSAARGHKDWSRAWLDFEKNWANLQLVDEMRRRR